MRKLLLLFAVLFGTVSVLSAAEAPVEAGKAYFLKVDGLDFAFIDVKKNCGGTSGGTISIVNTPVIAYFTAADDEKWMIGTKTNGGYLKVNKWDVNPGKDVATEWTIEASDVNGCYYLVQDDYAPTNEPLKKYLGCDDPTRDPLLYSTQAKAKAVKVQFVEAQTTYTVDAKTGTGVGTDNYTNLWSFTTSESHPETLTLSSGTNNNMKVVDADEGLLGLFVGNVSPWTYTLSVPQPNVIIGYSFDFVKESNYNDEITLTAGGKEYKASLESQSVKVDNLEGQSVAFTLSGNNKGIKVSNFKVNVVTYPINKIFLTNIINKAEEFIETTGFSFTKGEKVELSVGEGGNLSTNHPAVDSDVLGNCIDGNPATLFHSDWNVGTSGGHYLQVELREEQALDAFVIEYTTRQSGNNGAPYSMTISGSNNGTDYTVIETLTKDDKANPLPASNAKYYSATIVSSSPYRYWRFIVNESPNGNGSFGLAEFSITKATVTKTTGDYENRLSVINNLYNAVFLANLVNEDADAEQVEIDEAEAMVKYALGGAPFKEYPFTLTTDINTPVCYLIKSARSKTDQKQWGNPSYWNYQSQGENASYYTIKEYGNENGDELVKNDINSYWFFVENKYGYIELVPFINPVSMGYVTVGDGAKKMTNNHTIQNFVGTEYSFENNVNNSWEGYPYALKPYGYNTYVSNHGGRNNMMGFYNEINDGGTRFTLIAANTPSVMLRNLHVAVVEAQEEYGAISIGNQVGQYSTDTANEFKKALEEATELLANAKSTSEECQDKLEALNGAVANLKFNLPEVGKFYTIKSASTSDYCKGKYVYALSTPEAATYKTYDHRHLRFADMSPVRATALWQFTEDMKMKNVHTGEYVKSFGKDEQHMGAEAESKSISIRPLMNNDRQVSLTVSGASYPMHAQQDDAVIVVWSGGHNSASAWYIDEVNEFSHELNVGEAGWSSLVLGFDASIPDGIELYSVSEVENGAAILNPVTRVLPANTPVFVKAAKGNYQFDFSSEKPEAVKNNLLKGSLYDCYIGEESYVLAKGTSGVGLYKASLNKNASGAEGKSHFLNNANKAYMPASEVPAGARFLVFNFSDDDATAIEGIEAENTADAVVYDLAGRRVQNAQKGVFIVNGKVVVK